MRKDSVTVVELRLRKRWAQARESDSVGVMIPQIQRGQYVPFFHERIYPKSTLKGAMRCAIETGNAERVAELLDEGVVVNSTDFIGWTPLIQASHHGQAELVTLLLDRGADINVVADGDGYTALSEASNNGHLDVVRILVARGAVVNRRSLGGFTPLLWAALFDRLPVCLLLISKGADLSTTSDAPNSFSPLGDYGQDAHVRLSRAEKGARCRALLGAWRWAACGPLLMVLAENGFRPLRRRVLLDAATAADAAAAADPAFPPPPSDCP